MSKNHHGISSHWWFWDPQTPAKNTSKPLFFAGVTTVILRVVKFPMTNFFPQKLVNLGDFPAGGQKDVTNLPPLPSAISVRPKDESGILRLSCPRRIRPPPKKGGKGRPLRQEDHRLTKHYLGVSKNRGTPKWMVYNGKPYQNGWFGGKTNYFWKHPFLLGDMR